MFYAAKLIKAALFLWRPEQLEMQAASKTYAMLQNFKKVEFGCNEKEDIDTNG